MWFRPRPNAYMFLWLEKLVHGPSLPVTGAFLSLSNKQQWCISVIVTVNVRETDVFKTYETEITLLSPNPPRPPAPRSRIHTGTSVIVIPPSVIVYQRPRD